ncbi:MAG: aminomethyl-transferring glycine dehydrogenase subunit GcvPB [Candidatus Omnitrophota bacterium]
MQLIFEKSVKGKCGFKVSSSGVEGYNKLPKKYLRQEEPNLPEVSELDCVRHFTNLSRMNFSVDTNFYPLGSCTMKYNPKFSEKVAVLEGFCNLHPMIPLVLGSEFTSGAFSVISETEKLLSEILGMKAFTLEPMAGAHGELTGLMLIAAYHKHQGNRKKYVIVPNSSHGTNPASSTIAGYQTVVIPSNKNGCVDLEEYKKHINNETAAVMLTCPNTLGLFETEIKEVTDLAHKNGALVYYDGANLNAILGIARPGDLGFDVVHVNLHKTFATPHGGGGPGAGPVGVSEKLVDFLPGGKRSIGSVAPFYGNFGVILKAYAYILMLGKEGLIDVAKMSVLNANYIRVKLKDYYELPYERICMHECVFSASFQLENGVHAIDIAKYLIDKGIHPPTVYFPLIVKESLMIEPTETESKETLDKFIEVMIEIANLAKTNPQAIKDAPLTTPISRLDETKAVKDLKLKYNC